MSSAVLLVGVSLVLYVVGLLIYRLFFSPIAHIPGPRIAAVTGLYEVYYDVLCGGRYLWKIAEMHERYGPVVRITPDEVHIADPDFYSTLYASSAERRDKVAKNARQFGSPDSVLATLHHDLHRMRRATLNPFFSKASVYKLEPVIQDKVGQMIERLDDFLRTGEPVPLLEMFNAFTNDVVMEYAFAKSNQRLLRPDFDKLALEFSEHASELSHWILHMNWVLRLLQSMPLSLAKIFQPGLSQVVDFQEDIKRLIRDIQNGTNRSHEKTSLRTIFHAILASGMPDSEKRLERLGQEGVVVIGAGTETTAWTLVVGLVYILLDADVHRRLCQEIRDVPANERERLQVLEKLPYLGACIQEALRLSYGVTSRLPRVLPSQPLETPGPKPFILPPGTKVSMSAVLIHRDPSIFPEPDKFQPERWLNPAHRLDRYLVSFSKGARQCLGINLAYAELFLAFGAIFGRYGLKDDQPELRLVNGKDTLKDVEIASDLFVPGSKSGNKHVKAIFR